VQVFSFESIEIMDDFAERPWMGSQRLSKLNTCTNHKASSAETALEGAY
jgi:hypothetical protein